MVKMGVAINGNDEGMTKHDLESGEGSLCVMGHSEFVICRQPSHIFAARALAGASLFAPRPPPERTSAPIHPLRSAGANLHGSCRLVRRNQPGSKAAGRNVPKARRHTWPWRYYRAAQSGF